MLDFWKQPPNLLEYVAEYLGEGGTNKKNNVDKKMTSKE